MPSYEKPAKELLGEKLEVQLVAMWNSLNETTPPAVDGSSVEQIIAVKPKGRPVVLRDVFRLEDLGLRLRQLDRGRGVALESDSAIIGDAVYNIAKTAAARAGD